MNPRTAPVVRVVGGLSLALLCVQAGLQQRAGEPEAPAPTLEELVRLPEPPAPLPEPVRAALAPLPRFVVPSIHPVEGSCGSACGGFAATTGLFWNSADLASVYVSSPPLDDAAAARGADVPLAFAQAAVYESAQAAPPAASPAAEPPQPAWPAPPPLPSLPGSRGVEPVVAALFEPDLTPPTDTQLEPSAADPQGEGSTPMAGPLGAHTTPEGDPSASGDPLAPAGAPSKRGNMPGDKATGRPPAPLAQGPVFYPYAPSRGPAQGQGPLNDPASDAPPQGLPGDGPGHSPGQPSLFPGQQGHFPGLGPVAVPDPAPDWIAPWQDQGPSAPAPTQPLVGDPGLPDRVADGDLPNPLLTPRLDPVALPADLVDPALVTEPGALALLAAAALGLVTTRRARRPDRPGVPSPR